IAQLGGGPLADRLLGKAFGDLVGNNFGAAAPSGVELAGSREAYSTIAQAAFGARTSSRDPVQVLEQLRQQAQRQTQELVDIGRALRNQARPQTVTIGPG